MKSSTPKATSHKYLTLVYQIDPAMTRLLWIGGEKNDRVLLHGHRRRTGFKDRLCLLRHVAALPEGDSRECSQALHLLDRFHVVAKMNLAFDDVRAEESNRMRREGRVPVLKKSRWLVLRREHNLNACPPCSNSPTRYEARERT